jgi:hypothetical protein
MASITLTEALGILRFALALLLFWFPGFCWASWLHRGSAYHWGGPGRSPSSRQSPGRSCGFGSHSSSS